MAADFIETKLRDGTPVGLRPTTPDDGHLIEIGMEHLSKESKYYRFMRSISHLSEGDLHQLSQIDQVDHIAWGALDLTHEEQYPIGLARCVRLEGDPARAEVAVTVIDSHQGRGLGTMLLAAVARDAAHNGITQFAATVLSDNRKMLDLFAELGATRTRSYDTVEISFPIYNRPEFYPDTPTGNAFKNMYRLLDPGLPGQGASNA